MRRITLQQIEELTDREKRQLGSYITNKLDSLYKRFKRISLARREIEAGIEGEENEFSDS